MTLKRRDDRDEPGPVEKGVMLLSAGLVIALFSVTIYQGVTAPEDDALDVAVVESRHDGDQTLVSVALRNEGSLGWRAVTVEVSCDKPPPEATLENVPAGSVRTAILTCPAGTTSPEASISSRVPA